MCNDFLVHFIHTPFNFVFYHIIKAYLQMCLTQAKRTIDFSRPFIYCFINSAIVCNFKALAQIQKNSRCEVLSNLISAVYFDIFGISAHYLIRIVIRCSCGNDPNHLIVLVPLNAAIQRVCYIAKLKVVVALDIIAGRLNRHAVKHYKYR